MAELYKCSITHAQPSAYAYNAPIRNAIRKDHAKGQEGIIYNKSCPTCITSLKLYTCLLLFALSIPGRELVISPYLPRALVVSYACSTRVWLSSAWLKIIQIRLTAARLFRRSVIEVKRKFRCKPKYTNRFYTNRSEPAFRVLKYLERRNFKNIYYNRNKILFLYGV